MPAGIYPHKKMDRAKWRVRLEKRFWGRVKKMPSGCWEWQGARLGPTPDYPRLLNYGVTTLYKKMYRTHRVAYWLVHGSIPEGMLVLHTCDNPPCCNPDHLYLGDYQKNMDDRTARGRNRRTPQQIAEMRAERKRRYTNNPALRKKIGAASKKMWAAGIGPGSPEAQAKRTASIRAYFKNKE